MARYENEFPFNTNGRPIHSPDFNGEIAKNTRELKEILCKTNVAYNINEQFILLDTATITLPADTYHSYSAVVIAGSVDITEGGITFSNAPIAYSASQQAAGVLHNVVTFVGKSSGTIVVIKTIR